MKLRIWGILLFISGLFFLSSCQDKTVKQTNSPKELAIKFYPFYKDYIHIDTAKMGGSLFKLQKDYPEFLDFYLDTLLNLNIRGYYNERNATLKEILKFPDYKKLCDTVLAVFPDTKETNEAITKAFNNLSALNTQFNIPNKVFYYVSYLELATLIKEGNIMGIGLDMFLGPDFAPYQAVGIPAYATLSFTKENIPIRACRAIYDDRFPYEFQNKNLLELMIDKGKETYFLKQCLPDMDESNFFGFTKEQMDWCSKNEALIYHTLVQNNMLYNTNLQEIMKYVNEGPNTPGFAPEAPGNLGSYVGWKIVTQYAQQQKTTIEETLTNKDAQKILKQANYKP